MGQDAASERHHCRNTNVGSNGSGQESITDDMNIISKYSTFSRWFYLIVLGLTIPYYLLLYGASGHKFNPPPEDIIWMTVVVIAFGTGVIYLTIKEKAGLGFNLFRILFSITLLLTAYGGLKSFLFIVQFDYGDDINFIVCGLSYLIPLLFTLSSIIILLGLFIRKTE
ncbi:MAG: hypothetical protein EBR30_21160 [Cytophagia bacterium]|nr:hypothetical protein [Cytophagia bacterium]NBW37477.1 hypothetical protein [Cytophagia bacterium]